MTSLRSLPSVDALASELSQRLPRGLANVVARTAIDEARAAIQAGNGVSAGELAARHARRLELARPHRIINASGVLLHTNLGRAPLHPEAAEAAARVARSYGNIELDLDTGERGGRGAYLAALLTALTGAEAAHVVNNNAAALLLALAALAAGAEVPVSRGELIEIGGSYRLPELMNVSTAHLVEIGTTNRTRLSDYERALGPNTGLVLKVHPSNYRIVGFSEEVDMDELASLTSDRSVPLVYDVGSGLIDADVPWLSGAPPPWLAGEPGVRQELVRGVDLVLFSGDKLLGGPQAGILVGSRSLIDLVKRHPLARALRVDGSTMAALATTIELYLDGRAIEIPFWSAAAADADSLAARLHAIGGTRIEVEPGASLLGAGSVPGLEVPTPVGRWAGAGDRWRSFLEQDPPILTRRDQGDLIIDVRAVDPADDASIAAVVADDA